MTTCNSSPSLRVSVSYLLYTYTCVMLPGRPVINNSEHGAIAWAAMVETPQVAYFMEPPATVQLDEASPPPMGSRSTRWEAQAWLTLACDV